MDVVIRAGARCASRPCIILSRLAKGKQIEFGSLSNGSAFCEAKTAKLGGA